MAATDVKPFFNISHRMEDQMSNECLVCSEAVNISADVLVGEIIACGACGQEHELLMVDGQPKLALAPEVEEDWGE
ncbi:lysine biosynthesis protein LysW [Chromobacterium subtsugae]|uniref:Lysine biosynthesis protein LysW n=1 Tax=Chromobacterium subtsugae TaxID=251747 RepID=A0ABS7F839_9NEIS|nr:MULTISPECIES: alpha-aminoadipate/glutamate carrier protein LysW [Chromobacterium]MBW7565224.1 lysine biosynthesis protein LysW [Chromobacterium subtsugae]MBW8286248.1 lysine biosynthesis protein LysW [Chromobacterium subtsugae]WSE91701.1 lysine biosynthesis protein LysW [Chromobacterium subtsugae]WVH60076.1 alpha-aminoadipate/glutamate carrier protein LysW [Chromobacterium subtsugae]